MEQSILFCSSEDVKRLLPMGDAVRVVEKAFREHALGHMKMPPKIYLDLPEFGGDFRAMPSSSGRDRVAGIKWVNVHPGNRKKHLPSVMATYILNDAATGRPLAFMDGTLLTSLRTGAAGGVAAKHLSRKNASVAAFIGAGVQAHHQALALLKVRRLKEIRYYDPAQSTHSQFEKSLEGHFHGTLLRMKSPEKCVEGADIVTTTTPSRKPILMGEWISPGTHINAIGADAPGKQELEIALLKKARIFIDEIHQASHSGEINVAFQAKKISLRDLAGSLGEVVAGKSEGRRNDGEITIFDSTGLAVQDLAAATHVYRSARKTGTGLALPLF